MALRAFNASSSAIICLLGAALRLSSMNAVAWFFISRPPGPRFFSSAPSIAANCLDGVDVLRAQFGATCPR